MYLTTHHVTKTLNTWSHTDYVICLITKTEIQLLSNLAWHQDTDTGQLLANQRAKLWYHWVKHSTAYISIAAFQHPRTHSALCYKIENPSCLWYIDQTYQTLDWFFSNYVWIDWYLYININANCRMYCGLLNWHSESFSKYEFGKIKYTHYCFSKTLIQTKKIHSYSLNRRLLDWEFCMVYWLTSHIGAQLTTFCVDHHEQ